MKTDDKGARVYRISLLSHSSSVNTYQWRADRARVLPRFRWMTGESRSIEPVNVIMIVLTVTVLSVVVSSIGVPISDTIVTVVPGNKRGGPHSSADSARAVGCSVKVVITLSS